MNENSPKESVVDIPRPYHLSHNTKISESMKIRFLKIKLPDGEIIETIITEDAQEELDHKKNGTSSKSE